MDSKDLEFVPIYAVYEENNIDIVVTTSPRITPTSKHISFKYNYFRHHVGNKFVIQKTESENQNADTFTKGLQGEFLSGLGNLYLAVKILDDM